ncbi:MAG: aldo/keto reductase [Anaerolineales bacterium]
MIQRTQLGNTEISISPLGIGTWAWGDRVLWGYGMGDYTDEDIHQAYQASRAAGINFFDTAEIYGMGRSEKLLGEFLKHDDGKVLVATKYLPYPWRLRKASATSALEQSLKRLDLDLIDLYQIHWPMPPRSTRFWIKELGEIQKTGKIRSIGVSNYNLSQTTSSQNILSEMDLSLASNQMPYNLLDRRIERNGLLKYCQENKITLIAYSPLAKGLLTGKYSAEHSPPGIRKVAFNRKTLMKIKPLLALMKEIGKGNGGKTQAQVAINWTICKGALPIPGAKNLRQAKENLGAIGWNLTSAEVSALDQASDLIRSKES